jgi:hypothetical protein
VAPWLTAIPFPLPPYHKKSNTLAQKLKYFIVFFVFACLSGHPSMPWSRHLEANSKQLSIGVVDKNQTVVIEGAVLNYPNQTLKLFRAYADTAYFVDSAITSAKGNFVFKLNTIKSVPNGQYFLAFNNMAAIPFIFNGQSVALQITFQAYVPPKQGSQAPPANPPIFIKNDENKFYAAVNAFQANLAVAHKALLPILKNYPPTDAFYPVIKQEYQRRYITYDSLYQIAFGSAQSAVKYPLALKLMQAGYQNNVANLALSDAARDSLFLANYFIFCRPN